jgi:hypothetical protein
MGPARPLKRNFSNNNENAFLVFHFFMFPDEHKNDKKLFILEFTKMRVFLKVRNS